MKAIIPLSPPSYKQGNLPGNVKDLCAYARNLQEQVDFYLGQLQKACADANTAMEQIQKGVESINALYNYREETKTLNIIPATSFNGKATFKDIALHEKGSAVRGALKGTSGSNGYVRIMVITIKAEYVNSPILFEYVNRGRDPVSGYIRFANSDGTDPGIDACRYSCPTACPFYIYKRAAGTWDVYVEKSEAYDNIGITRLSADYGYLGSRLNIEIDGSTIVPSLPSGYITATPYNAFIDSLTTIGKATLGSASIGGNDVAVVVASAGVSGIWTWKKYSDGTADCWGVLDIGSVTADKFNTWANLYEAVISSGVDFPFAFTNPPCLIRSISTANGAGMVMEYTPTAGNTGKTSLVRTSKAGVAGVKIHFHASGRWK